MRCYFCLCTYIHIQPEPEIPESSAPKPVMTPRECRFDASTRERCKPFSVPYIQCCSWLKVLGSKSSSIPGQHDQAEFQFTSFLADLTFSVECCTGDPTPQHSQAACGLAPPLSAMIQASSPRTTSGAGHCTVLYLYCYPPSIR